MEEMSQRGTRCQEFLIELASAVSNPIHKRLIQSYRIDDPVQAMESELAEILLEVFDGED